MVDMPIPPLIEPPTMEDPPPRDDSPEAFLESAIAAYDALDDTTERDCFYGALLSIASSLAVIARRTPPKQPI